MSEEQTGGAAETEREMREHEREARERDSDERDPDAGGEPAENAAPPGNVQTGEISGGS
jgi:hypothetical protein